MKATGPFDAIREYRDLGIAAFPLLPRSKRPAIASWEPFKSRTPTDEEIDQWEAALPADCNVAIVCGAVSKLAVLDCDTEEAMTFAEEAGLTTALRVRTSRGMHYYFQLDRATPKIPKFKGRHDIQLQADKSYVAAPPSVHKSGHTYSWVDLGLSVEDALEDLPMWREPDLTVSDPDFDFSKLDLRDNSIGSTLADIEWRVGQHGKLRDGDGRNTIMTKYVGELVADRQGEAAVRLRIEEFQRRYFADELDEEEVNTIVRSIYDRDRKAHPERYDPNTGEPKHKADINDEVVIFAAHEVAAMPHAEIDYLVEPWLQKPGITMVHGASGAGKSLFVSLGLWHAGLGKDFGPFAVKRPVRTLYIDAEMGRNSIVGRYRDFHHSYGDPRENLLILAEGLQKPNVELNVDPRDEAGQRLIQKLALLANVDAVVFDNIRTMSPGMEEADAAAWSEINDFARKLRNLGLAVVIVHHSNKTKTENGVQVPGSYAGSSNAVTVCDTVVQVREVIGGSWKITTPDGKEIDAIQLIEKKIDEHWPGAVPHHAIRTSYDKVRDRDPALHVEHLIGVVEMPTGQHKLAHTSSNKQRLSNMLATGRYTVNTAATELKLPLHKVRKWAGEL